jgi:hypothetical protein
MDFFINIDRSWNMIAHRPVIGGEGSHQFSSLSGRVVCLVHLLATPLKVVSGIGLLVLNTARAVGIIFGVLTFNIHPKYLSEASICVIDVVIGVPLLPIAIIANIIRGIVGTIFHPGAMIRECSAKECETYAVKHNILYGTLVNYPIKK